MNLQQTILYLEAMKLPKKKKKKKAKIDASETSYGPNTDMGEAKALSME